MPRCWAVTQTFTSKSRGREHNSCTRGQSLMASGRVPNTQRIRTMKDNRGLFVLAVSFVAAEDERDEARQNQERRRAQNQNPGIQDARALRLLRMRGAV